MTIPTDTDISVLDGSLVSPGAAATEEARSSSLTLRVRRVRVVTNVKAGRCDVDEATRMCCSR